MTRARSLPSARRIAGAGLAPERLRSQIEVDTRVCATVCVARQEPHACAACSASC